MKPNIVCISIDSLRADYCSFINEDEKTTPFLSSLGNESTVYESTITPSIWTLPVHTSVFTGLFPPEHGINTGTEVLGDQPTFAEQLQSAGYTTQAFYDNAWLDTGDILRGFNSSSTATDDSADHSMKDRMADQIGRLSSTLQTIVEDAYQAQGLYRSWRTPESAKTPKDTDGQTKVTDAISSTKDADQPFCWFLHFDEAHWKYNPPNPFHREFTDRSVLGLVYNYIWWQDRVYGSRTGRLETITGEIEPPKREIETFKDLYRGGIRYCDALIEQLVEGFKAAGVWDNTILILFGDHGDSFGENGVFGHHFSTDDSLIRVPLIIRDPTEQLSPDRVSSPVSLVDIYPTVLDLAGVDVPDCSGVNLINDVRESAYTYYDVSEHDYYTEASSLGIKQSALPAATQHVIWQSPTERLTWHPAQEETKVVGDNREILWECLQAHTEQLSTLETGGRDLSDSVKQQLEDMGYLRE